MNKTFLYRGLISLVAIFILIFILRGSFKSTPLVIKNVTKEELATTTEKVPVLLDYIEVQNSCEFDYVGDCVNVRSGPGTEFKVVGRLRTGVVLKVEKTVHVNNKDWYKISFKDLKYPERITDDWYVSSGDYIRAFTDVGEVNVKPKEKYEGNKHIIVDISEQTLYAYEGDTLFMEELISTGLEFTPTPSGTFHVFKKTPSRFMQGPIEGVSEQVYDLPGVPWDLYFTSDGAVIHGAYWHDHFGQPWSHGCINLTTEDAKKLYEWADINIPVTVKR